MKKRAFTLAEVLVTLGIIGVVAALTVPTLMQNHQRKVYVTQLQKVYTELSQAFTRKINDSNAINLRESGFRKTNDMAKEKEFLHTYFKVTKDCGTTATPCFAESYNTINGQRTVPPNYDNNDSYYFATLASGASIGISWVNDLTTPNTAFWVVIDTNGAQGPNILCRDYFATVININGDFTTGNNSQCIPYLASHGWIMDEEFDRIADTGT